MDSSIIVENAISTLANTMRIYGEAHMRFDDLFKIDREEAIDNIDRSFEMMLESFHTLYDVSKHLFPYFEHGDTALVIAVRNAIHHRDHPLFWSLQRRLHLDKGGVERWLGASFLLASHPTRHGAPIRMSHHVRLDDLDARLDPSLASTQRWTAILTVTLQPPRDAERLKANPLGIYVNAINWSREMGQ